MRFLTIIAATGLAHVAFAATLPTVDNDLALFDSHPLPTMDNDPALSDSHPLHRRAEYKISQLDDLEEEAEDASLQQILQGVHYLANIFHTHNIQYALMGGIAMQLYGMRTRTTHDSDMAVSAAPATVINSVKNDKKVQYPPATAAASGAFSLFVKIGNQHVQSDIFSRGGDNTPSLEGAVNISGYRVISLLELVKSKCKAHREQDIEDVIWLANHKSSEVKAIAGKISKSIRMEMAEAVKEDNPKSLKIVCAALGINPKDVDSDSE